MELGFKEWKWSKRMTVRGNLHDLLFSLKRGWRRFWTGMDPYALWNYDLYFIEHFHRVILWYISSRHGSPPMPCPFDEQKQCDEGGCKDCKLHCHQIFDTWLVEMAKLAAEIKTEEYGPYKQESWNALFEELKTNIYKLWD